MDGEGKHVDSREHAVTLDAQDPLSNIRKEFLIPTKAQLKSGSLPEAGNTWKFYPSPYYVLTNLRIL